MPDNLKSNHRMPNQQPQSAHHDTPQDHTAYASFAPRVLAWFAEHGRHDLPWQQHHKQSPDPYPVWLSEVMLQQTQVATVKPYFARFMASFATVQALAAADWADVAAHWAGLGYYARARNLHKGAQQLAAIIAETGDFPQTVDEWQQIAGVGQSTAGAVVAMGVRGYGVICDGNVKRVLTRWAGIDGDITKSATNRILWQLAERLTPSTDSGLYAQAMMDLGATLCTKAKPACLLCPVNADCVARAEGNPTAYPVKAKAAARPRQLSLALLLTDANGRVLWLTRPDSGIWGGLVCLPLLFYQKLFNQKPLEQTPAATPKTTQSAQSWQDNSVFAHQYNAAEQIIVDVLAHMGKPLADIMTASQIADLTEQIKAPQSSVSHGLTHMEWWFKPYQIMLDDDQVNALNHALGGQGVTFGWHTLAEAQTLALPKAMHKVLAQMPTDGGN